MKQKFQCYFNFLLTCLRILSIFTGNGCLLILEAFCKTSIVSSTLPMANNHLGDSGTNLIIRMNKKCFHHISIKCLTNAKLKKIQRVM